LARAMKMIGRMREMRMMAGHRNVSPNELG